MLTNTDFELLSGMLKDRLERLIIQRVKEEDHSKPKDSLDREINTLYKLLAKIITLSEGNIEDNYSITSDKRINANLSDIMIGYERLEFTHSLRHYWSELAYAVNAAIQYTYDESPERMKYDEICILLAQAIDNLRSYYKNIKADIDGGLYPFEPIKEVYHQLLQLGYGQFDEGTRFNIRSQMADSWKSMRESFLTEFNRTEPRKPVSKYL